MCFQILVIDSLLSNGCLEYELDNVNVDMQVIYLTLGKQTKTQNTRTRYTVRLDVHLTYLILAELLISPQDSYPLCTHCNGCCFQRINRLI